MVSKFYLKKHKLLLQFANGSSVNIFCYTKKKDLILEFKLLQKKYNKSNNSKLIN